MESTSSNRVLGPITLVRPRRLYFRLPGCARALDERRQVSGCSSRYCQQHADSRSTNRPILRHDRLADQECPEQQRPRRHLRDFVSGILHFRRLYRFASGTQSLFAAGAGFRLVSRRRHAPQRSVVSCSKLVVSSASSARIARRRSSITATLNRGTGRRTPDGYDFFLECRRVKGDRGPVPERPRHADQFLGRDDGSIRTTMHIGKIAIS